jgi:hypothetical protein
MSKIVHQWKNTDVDGFLHSDSAESQFSWMDEMHAIVLEISKELGC